MWEFLQLSSQTTCSSDSGLRHRPVHPTDFQPPTSAARCGIRAANTKGSKHGSQKWLPERREVQQQGMRVTHVRVVEATGSCCVGVAVVGYGSLHYALPVVADVPCCAPAVGKRWHILRPVDRVVHVRARFVQGISHRWVRGGAFPAGICATAPMRPGAAGYRLTGGAHRA